MSKAIVEQVKAELEAAGENLSTPCGAFKITKKVAQRLASTGAGLLSKPSGNNCDGYAVDIIAYSDGRIFDCLIDGGGANEPSWNPGEKVDPSRWVPVAGPTEPPVEIPDPPPTNPPATPCNVNLKPLEASVESIEGILRAVSQGINTLQVKLNLLDEKVRLIEQRQDRAYSGRIFGVNFTLDVRKD